MSQYFEKLKKFVSYQKESGYKDFPASLIEWNVKPKDDETNQRVIKINERKGTLGCTKCPPNKGENSKRGNQYHNKHKSWKFRTKKSKQFE